MERTGRQYGRVTYCPYSDTSSSELQSYVRPFDTVRALHETVVSLRTALEESRREVDQLRQQINVRETVDQGRASVGFRGIEQADGQCKQQPTVSGAKPSTSGFLKQPENLYASRGSCEDIPAVEDKKPKKFTKRKGKTHPPPLDESCSSPLTVEEEPKRVEDPVRPKKTPAKDGSSSAHQKVSVVPDIQIVSHPGGGTHSAMASRIDVKIKVSSNINMDGSSSEAESSECLKDSPTTPDAGADQTPEDEEKTIAEPDERGADDEVTIREQVVNAEGVENLRVSVVNEEHLSVSKSSDAISIKQISSENLHVDTDRQSNASISEGDNSVFAEDPATGQPEEETHGTGPITGSYTLSDPSNDPRRRIKKSESENQEEVDDIELIFSSDDNAKDITQEDLVSISDYEPWHEAGQSGTPVLVSFTNLTSDQEKMSSLERSDSEVVEGYELAKGKSLESQDSLSMDNMKKSMDFSTKSSSLEKDSSLDYGASGGTVIPALARASSSQDEDGKQNDSFDVAGTNPLAAAGALGRRWTNYNVLIETDISKCGITEENILEMGRRNTCPNPPAYRPIIHPGSRIQPTGGSTNRSPLAVKFSRSPRTYSPHQYLPPGKTLRTVIAAESGVRGATGDEVKRSQAAQTDISALAQQWRSETHLTGSEYVPGLYTLPSKFVPPTPGGKGKFPLR
uniref:Uncharacterized protein n=1 Tax=Anopheles minimus TaxID=112268 RepID=A0A182WFN5_9DIPT